MTLTIVPPPDERIERTRENLIRKIQELPLGEARELLPLIDRLGLADLGHLTMNLQAMVAEAEKDRIVQIWKKRLQSLPKQGRYGDLLPEDYQKLINRRVGREVESHFDRNVPIFPLPVLYGVLLGATIPPVWVDQAVSLLTGSDAYPNIYGLNDAPDTLSFLTNRIAAMYELNGCESHDKVMSNVFKVPVSVLLGILATPAINWISSFRPRLSSTDLTKEPAQFQRRYAGAKIGRLAGFALHAAVLATAAVGAVQQHYLWKEADIACATPEEPRRITAIQDIRPSSLEERLKETLSHLPYFRIRSYDEGVLLPNQVRDGALEVYFPTASSELYPSQSAGIQAVALGLGSKRDYVIEGHADHRGTVEANYELGKRRAEAVAQAIPPMGARITIVSVGEREATLTMDEQQLASDRKARLVFYENPVELGIQRAKTDGYLIDTSEAMQPYWQDLQRASFPFPSVWVPGARVGFLDAIHPEGQADVNASLADLLRATTPGKSLAIVTAGGFPASGYDEVRQIAQDRSIPLSIVGLGLSAEDITTLGTLARETGGSTYFIMNDK